MSYCLSDVYECANLRAGGGGGGESILRERKRTWSTGEIRCGNFLAWDAIHYKLGFVCESRDRRTNRLRHRSSPVPTLVCFGTRKLSYKLSLINSRQLSCNSCSRLTRTRELRKLSYKLSLGNSHQLSCNSCSRLTRT